jgi:hypothetical protein
MLARVLEPELNRLAGVQDIYEKQSQNSLPSMFKGPRPKSSVFDSWTTGESLAKRAHSACQ